MTTKDIVSNKVLVTIIVEQYNSTFDCTKDEFILIQARKIAAMYNTQTTGNVINDYYVARELKSRQLKLTNRVFYEHDEYFVSTI